MKKLTDFHSFLLEGIYSPCVDVNVNLRCFIYAAVTETSMMATAQWEKNVNYCHAKNPVVLDMLIAANR